MKPLLVKMIMAVRRPSFLPKWMALLCCLGVASTWLIGKWYYVGIGHPNRYLIIVDQGALILTVAQGPTPDLLGEVGIRRACYYLKPLPPTHYYFAGSGYAGQRLILPFWLLFVITSVFSAVCWTWDRRTALREKRRQDGLCLLCGYDLRGSPTGRCPECGEQMRVGAEGMREYHELASKDRPA